MTKIAIFLLLALNQILAPKRSVSPSANQAKYNYSPKKTSCPSFHSQQSPSTVPKKNKNKYLQIFVLYQKWALIKSCLEESTERVYKNNIVMSKWEALIQICRSIFRQSWQFARSLGVVWLAFIGKEWPSMGILLADIIA